MLFAGSVRAPETKVFNEIGDAKHVNRSIDDEVTTR